MSRVAVVQIRGDRGLEGNLQRSAELLAQAADAGAVLIVLPENFAYYGRRTLQEAGHEESSPRGPVRHFLHQQASALGVWLAGGTVPTGDGTRGRPYAASLLISPDGKEVARYNKIHLFDVDVPETGQRYRESDDYQPGSDIVVAETPLGKIGMSVCYDLRFPELYRQLVAGGAEILLAPSAFTATTGKAHWELLLRARAMENQCYMLGANLCHREHPNKPTWGNSMIVDPWGRVLIAMAGDEGFVCADLDLDELHRLRRDMPVLDHRRLG